MATQQGEEEDDAAFSNVNSARRYAVEDRHHCGKSKKINNAKPRARSNRPEAVEMGDLKRMRVLDADLRKDHRMLDRAWLTIAGKKQALRRHGPCWMWLLRARGARHSSCTKTQSFTGSRIVR